MCKRIIILAIYVGIVLLSSINVRSYNLSSIETISVEVKGEVESEGIYEMELGSNIGDLLTKTKLKSTADTSKLSYLHILRNNEIVYIPRKSISNLISINSASLYELSALPGIGKSIALKIVEYREQYGSFLTLDSLKNVSGIGDKKYERIKQYICL